MGNPFRVGEMLRRELWNFLISSFWITIFIVVLAFLDFIMPSPRAIIAKIVILISTFWGRLLAMSFLLAIAQALFLLKKHQQFWYGLFETLFAFSACFYVSTTLEEGMIKRHIEPVILITVVSTIYIVVRGYSNLDEGKRKNYIFKRTLSKFKFLNN